MPAILYCKNKHFKGSIEPCKRFNLPIEFKISNGIAPVKVKNEKKDWTLEHYLDCRICGVEMEPKNGKINFKAIQDKHNAQQLFSMLPPEQRIKLAMKLTIGDILNSIQTTN